MLLAVTAEAIVRIIFEFVAIDVPLVFCNAVEFLISAIALIANQDFMADFMLQKMHRLINAVWLAVAHLREHTSSFGLHASIVSFAL